MPRIQSLSTYTNKLVAAAATPEVLYASSKKVSSVIIQALSTNTDFIYIGNSSNQTFALAPGKSIEIHGDGLDHGTSAWFDINEIYIRVNVNGEGVAYMTLDNN